VPLEYTQGVSLTVGATEARIVEYLKGLQLLNSTFRFDTTGDILVEFGFLVYVEFLKSAFENSARTQRSLF
jgi:hypothetical protein